MKCLRIGALGVFLLVCCASQARADGFISPFIGFNYGGNVAANCVSLTNCEEKRSNYGIAFGATGGILGFEEEIGYSKNFFGKAGTGDNAVLTVMSNVMVIIPAGPIQPYGIIGLGLIRPHITFDADSLDLAKNALGYDIGGGLNIYVTHALGLRGDIRRMQTLNDVTLGLFSDEKLDFWRGSAALTLRF